MVVLIVSNCFKGGLVRKMVIKIYTDGACSGNPGPGGWGSIICLPTEIKKISGSEQETTNNRMELSAVVNGMSEISNMIFQESQNIEKLEIISDSAYVVNSITKGWLEVWKKNGYKNSKCEDVKNLDLWLKMDEMLQEAEFIGLQVVFTKIKGHNGDYFNEMVDKLAKSEISKKEIK